MQKRISKAIGKALLLILLSLTQVHCFAQSFPLANGFAHNDYCQKHPLYDALDNGFTNIEADIFLKNNNLIVAHVFPYFKSKRTLEALYLKPLAERAAANNGRIYANYNAPVILMIDIKTNAAGTYKALKPLLEKYRAILTGMENGEIVDRAVTVVLSGHRPYGLIQNEQDRLAFIDEDLRKVSRDSSTCNVFSMASCKYSKLIRWEGKGVISAADKRRLCAFVAMAHRMGEKVRLWASPEKKVVWDELLSCGVDLINTDKLPALKHYLASRQVVLAKAD